MPICPHRVALVTGAARGIGRGIALRLAQDGFTVIVNHVSPADPGDIADGPYEVKHTIEQAGGKAEVCRADIAQAAERSALMAFVEDRFGRLDLLVNNAGIAPSERRDLLEASEESFDTLITTNLKGPYFLTQLAANKMIGWKEQGTIEQARVVFVTSISAYTASVNRGDYCISKAGLAMAAQLYAVRLAEYGIPVIEIRPGIIETRMTGPVKGKYDKLIEEGLLPTARWGAPNDVAAVVSAAGRGDFDYSTGVSIDVSGGFNIRRL